MLLAVVGAVTGCGGSSAKSADEIASNLRQAVRQTEGAPLNEAAAEQTAQQAVCTALDVAGSEGTERLVAQLRQEAALARIRADLGLEEYDPGAADRLAAAADAIDSAQKAAEVANLFCP